MSDVILYFDGRCTGNGTPHARAGYGWVIERDGKELASGKGMVDSGMDRVTVHVGEYAGLIVGLRALLELRGELGEVNAVGIWGDSQTVIRQVTGAHGCWAEHLQPLYREVHKLAGRLQAAGCAVALRWIPRGENARADELSREAFEERERAGADGDEYDGRGDPVALPVGTACG